MRVRSVVIAALVGLLAACAAAGPAPSPSATPEAPVRVIVELVSRDAAAEVLDFVGGRATDVRQTETTPYLIMRIPESFVAELAAHPLVVRVSRDQTSAPDG